MSKTPAKKARGAATAAAPEPAGAKAARTAPLRKKDLVAQVAAATGGKRKEVREAVEATLAAIGDALARGDELNLPPLGHVKVQRQATSEAGARMVLRLRRGSGPAGEKDLKEALADAGE